MREPAIALREALRIAQIGRDRVDDDPPGRTVDHAANRVQGRSRVIRKPDRELSILTDLLTWTNTRRRTADTSASFAFTSHADRIT